MAHRSCVSRLSRGLAIQTTTSWVSRAVVTSGSRSDSGFYRRRGSSNGVREGSGLVLHRQGPWGRARRVEEIPETGPRLAPSRAVSNGLPAARNHGINSLWGSREEGVCLLLRIVSRSKRV